MSRLRGKTAIVTGAASGIGKSIASRFATEGANVILSDISDEGYKVAEELVAAGYSATFHLGNVSSEENVKGLIGFALRWGNHLDVLVNNAGRSLNKTVVTADNDDWAETMDVNLKGAWYCCKHAIPEMICGGGGSIINIASTHAFRTQPEHFPYQASKAGMISMAKGITVDFGRQGIRANSICPGFIMTPMAERFLQQSPVREAKEKGILASHPVGRFGYPEDVANVAVFLASDEAAFVSGISLVVDGGRSCLQTTG